MTDTHEAERLADSIKASGQFTPLAELDAAAALLRRFPELEAELQTALGQVRYLMKDQEIKAAENDQLRAELGKVRVPEGWKLVPMKCDEAMKDVGIQFEFATVADGRLLAQTMWSELLAATPTPPAQAAADARDALLTESARWEKSDHRLAVWEALRVLGSRMGVMVTREDQYAALATHQQGGKHG